MTNRDKLNELFAKECQEVIAMSDKEIVEKGIRSCQFSQRFCNFLQSLGFTGHTWDEDVLMRWLQEEAQE